MPKCLLQLEVTFDADLPVIATKEEIQAWLEFHLRADGELSDENPLAGQELEAKAFSVKFRVF